MIHDILSGTVVRGQGRGALLGFPTANIQLDQGQIHPPTGIFAGRVRIGLARPAVHHPRHGRPIIKKEAPFYVAAIHIGPVPTFNETGETVEVHLLNYPGDNLLGQRLTVELGQKIREIKKFSSEEELVTAIASDCAIARKLVAAMPDDGKTAF